MRSLKTHLPGSPGIETKRVGQCTAAYGTDLRKIPPFRGGESDTRITLGWVVDRSVTPKAQWVRDTFTVVQDLGKTDSIQDKCAT